MQYQPSRSGQSLDIRSLVIFDADTMLHHKVFDTLSTCRKPQYLGNLSDDTTETSKRKDGKRSLRLSHNSPFRLSGVVVMSRRKMSAERVPYSKQVCRVKVNGAFLSTASSRGLRQNILQTMCGCCENRYKQRVRD